MGSLGLSLTLALLLALSTTCKAQLSPTFYDTSCPKALATIRDRVRIAISRERRLAASLIRLHFHDCFVQGCDASILIEDSTQERSARQNINSVRGFEVIEDAKSHVESICPGVVSCADILTVAARDSSDLVGGPTWTVPLGRRDSPAPASLALATSDLPLATDSLQSLIDLFDGKGLNTRDMVALSGSHTVGQARCVTFRARVNSNTSDIDPGFASTRRRRCPADVTRENNTLAPLDLVTPNQFDNNYFKNLLQKKGLLASDQVLFTGSGGGTDSIVTEYSKTPASFNSDFAVAMIKMGDISPLTGSAGQIRRVCGAAN